MNQKVTRKRQIWSHVKSMSREQYDAEIIEVRKDYNWKSKLGYNKSGKKIETYFCKKTASVKFKCKNRIRFIECRAVLKENLDSDSDSRIDSNT